VRYLFKQQAIFTENGLKIPLAVDSADTVDKSLVPNVKGFAGSVTPNR
jgi:hypothetical protein